MMMTRLATPRTTRAKERREGDEGFSLVELMVVVIVLAILAATIVPQFAGVTSDARNATARSTIKLYDDAIERFNVRYDRYPTTEEGLNVLVEGPKGAKNFRPLVKELVDDPWGNPFQYRSPGQHGSKSYDLWSMGADGQTGGEDKNKDIVNWKEESTTPKS